MDNTKSTFVPPVISQTLIDKVANLKNAGWLILGSFGLSSVILGKDTKRTIVHNDGETHDYESMDIATKHRPYHITWLPTK